MRRELTRAELLRFGVVGLLTTLPGGSVLADSRVERAAGRRVLNVASFINYPSDMERTKQFSKETGITVNYQYIPYDSMLEKVSAALVAGTNAYDVILSDDSWIARLHGFYEPIEHLIPAHSRGDLLPTARHDQSYDGHLYGLQSDAEYQLFYYNKRMFLEAGLNPDKPPETWTELAEYAQRLTKGPQYGITAGWAQSLRLAINYEGMVLDLGGKIVDPGNRAAFNSKEGMEALNFMVELQDKLAAVAPGSLSATGEMATKVMQEGRAAMMTNWNFYWDPLQTKGQSRVVGEIGVGLIPGARHMSCYAMGGYSIPKNCPDKEAAWKYIWYMAGPEGEKGHCIQNGLLPIWSSLYKDPDLKRALPYLSVAYQQVKHTFTQPFFPQYIQATNALEVYIQDALLKRASVKSALDQAEAAWNSVLS